MPFVLKNCPNVSGGRTTRGKPLVIRTPFNRSRILRWTFETFFPPDEPTPYKLFNPLMSPSNNGSSSSYHPRPPGSGRGKIPSVDCPQRVVCVNTSRDCDSAGLKSFHKLSFLAQALFKAICQVSWPSCSVKNLSSRHCFKSSREGDRHALWEKIFFPPVPL